MGNGKKVLLLLFFIFLVFNIELKSNDNINSRILPVYSLIHDGTYHIDNYRHLTGDQSFINGHYYTDKAPLVTFITMAVTYPFKYLIDLEKINFNFIIILGTIACSILPFIFYCYYVCSSKKIEIQHLIFFILSSFILVYTNALFSHVLTGVLCFFSYIKLKEEKYITSGLLLGLAISSEFTVGVFIFPWLFHLNDFKISQVSLIKIKKVLWFIAGLLPLMIVIMIYHKILTDSFFKTAYHFEDNEAFKDMRHSLGFSPPHPLVFLRLIIGQYKGIIFYNPIFYWLIFYLYRNRDHLSEFISESRLALLTVGILLLVNSSYFYWHGGFCHGPRIMIPAIFLLLYEILIFIKKFNINKYRFLFYSSGLFGISMNAYFMLFDNRFYDFRYKFPIFQLYLMKIIKNVH